MQTDSLNQMLSRYHIQFDKAGMQVAGEHYAYTDIVTVHYIKPSRRRILRLLITMATVFLAGWSVMAYQYQSRSIILAIGLLVGLTVARFYLLGRVFPKLSVTLKDGRKVVVMQKFDLIASDAIYQQLQQRVTQPIQKS